MNILECEIEELLFNNLKNEQLLRDRGFHYFEQHYYLHPNFGSYGIPDIVGVTIRDAELPEYKVMSATIYELKKESININTLLQASRYAKAINRVTTEIEDLCINEVDIKIVLIGKKIDLGSDFVYVADICDNLHLVTYSIDMIKGVSFNRHYNYSMSNEILFDVKNYISDFNKGLLSADKTKEIPF